MKIPYLKDGATSANMKITQNKRNPYLMFLPFLIFAIILILVFSKTQFTGDEPRYLIYAKNLTHGYFSPPYPYIDLGNGPGYPLILSPFVGLNSPLIYIRLLNALFYYFSIIFLYKTLERIVSYKFTLVFSLIWAFYPNSFIELPLILPEVFATSLIPLFVYCLIKGFDDTLTKKRKYLIFAGLTFGFLILTKPIFAYVLICLFLAILPFWFLKRKNKDYKNSLIVLFIAFLLNVPYLAYTYNLTGKMFYWSSFGGNNLYWMSSPFKEEYGSYYRFPFQPSSDRIPGSEKIIQLHHQKDFEEMLKNPEVRKANIRNGVIRQDLSNGTTQDDLLKEMAIKNIKAYPLKFLQNCISNAGRIIFNYPASYVLQKPSTLSRLPINGTLLVLMVYCLIPTLINWKRLFFPIRFLLLFSFFYFGGSLLGSAETRMFTKIVPILLLWIALILSKTVKVKLKFNE